MASIAKDKNGTRRILFVAPDGRRPTIRLGKVSQRAAESIKYRVEQLLESLNLNRPMEADLAQWVADLEPKMAKKLANVGLVPDPEAKPVATLGPFLQAWLASRKGDYKPTSLIAWGQVVNALTGFLGADCPLTEVTPDKAEAFRQSMLAAELRATTIHKRLQHARMFFAHAKRQGLVDANPFEFVRHRPGDASERRAYVPLADVERAIEHAPNGTWKLLIALSRFAGLRVPSEALSLRWQDVDWERGRLTVPSPKTQHLAGRSYRVIPLFPAVRPYLEKAWDDAPEGAEYVIPEEYRRRAQGPAGWANANLRTTLAKVIRRAGLEPWSRLWHSMRASCETDLARKFPLAVVAKWLGNTQAVAMRHYVDVTDADFERAIAGVGAEEHAPTDAEEKAAQKAAQSERAGNGCESQAEGGAHEKTPVLQGSATCGDTLQNRGLEAAGIEPASCDTSVKASTCVFCRLSFALVGSTDKAYSRLAHHLSRAERSGH
ncbi:site-specific tyrosine recombinase XerC [Symmachiella macrocystis]|uniref:Site-specific tyrosine recombinase XerC n=1 Tax=Symmachiella macrocystis TaxID=2527985 RepID=A0A5C6B3K3_9PLAN|nr:site-specific tyrosine recombinase XerC [Symmachiella macrocystis]